MSRWGRHAAIIAVAAAAGLLTVGLALLLKRDDSDRPLAIDPTSGWREVAWELPVAPWWPSRQFRCVAAACGADIMLYLRIKIGFCNCAEGIADDAELERISDFINLARRQEPPAEGQTFVAAGLKGRVRPYRLTLNGPTEEAADSVLAGLNSGCDAVVATAIGHAGKSIGTEETTRAIAGFVESAAVRSWIMRALGR